MGADGLGLRSGCDEMSELRRDALERDEKRLAELGRRTVEMFALGHIFTERLEVSSNAHGSTCCGNNTPLCGQWSTGMPRPQGTACALPAGHRPMEGLLWREWMTCGPRSRCVSYCACFA